MRTYKKLEKQNKSAYDTDYHEKHRLERNARARAWNAAHRDHARKMARDRNMRYKRMVYDHYGWVCVCCGVTEEAFLTIDHKDNDGQVHRQMIGFGAAYYKWIVDFNYPDYIQVLCMNCNYGKRRRPVCPHQADKLVSSV